MAQLTCGFVGLGLIGGSIAKALRRSIPDIRLLAYDVSEDTLKASLADGITDQITRHIDENFAACDYIFLCGPVRENELSAEKVKQYLSPDAILTDVGSVKTDIHKRMNELSLSHRFIGGHPMAGSERYGYLNSKAGLLENAYYILTPAECPSSVSLVPEEKVTAFRELVQKMGAIPLLLDAAGHDYVTAAVSHLPHVIASSLVNLVKDSDSGEGIMKMIAAGGFKDITRIASSSADMWQQICLTNAENVSRLLGDYIASLTNIKEQLEHRSGDALYDLFDNARIYRDSFIDISSGPIKISYSLNVDIADEPGALAAIATILALNHISIKNIGIIHNREFEEGVLRIEFHDEPSLHNAGIILHAKGYYLYEKKL